MILDASILSSMYKGEKIGEKTGEKMVKKLVKKGWKKLSQNYRKSVEYSRIFSAGFIVYIGKV